MISFPSHVRFMALILATVAVLYCLPYEDKPFATVVVFTALFPIQIILWRLGYSRKAKDFFFCLSFLIANLVLKHYWPYADLLFYGAAILTSAVLRYRVFLAVTGSAAALEVLRENYYATEGAEEVGFRYILFLAAGTLT